MDHGWHKVYLLDQKVYLLVDIQDFGIQGKDQHGKVVRHYICLLAFGIMAPVLFCECDVGHDETVPI